MDEEKRIEWACAEPRQGLAGGVDQLVGPGATVVEVLLTLGCALLGGIAAPAYAAAQGLGWTWIQHLVAALMAADLAGGIVANATSSAKRWWHRPKRGLKQHLAFVAIHHYPLLVAVLFRDMDWLYYVTIYGFLMLAAWIMVKVPLYLQRPSAAILFMVGLLIGLYAFPPAAGLEWFVPAFYLKLVLEYLPREEPYRPAGSSTG